MRRVLNSGDSLRHFVGSRATTVHQGQRRLGSPKSAGKLFIRPADVFASTLNAAAMWLRAREAD